MTSTKWFKYEIDAEISTSSVSSFNFNVPEQIIGFSKDKPIEVTAGKAKYGGIIWGRKSDKVLRLDIEGQHEETIEVTLTFIATGQIDEWPASCDKDVKFGYDFLRTLRYHNRNVKQDQAPDDDFEPYSEAKIPAYN